MGIDFGQIGTRDIIRMLLRLSNTSGKRKIHEYFGVSLRILWETIEPNLPPLVPLLEEILASEGEN
jgi:uncharacterized protein with HEPN domain